LINKIEERGWVVLNGSFGKECGWTYREVGSSVIDYIIGNDSNRKGKIGRRRKQNGVGSYTIESRVDRTADNKEK